jgi:hypothetical protein
MKRSKSVSKPFSITVSLLLALFAIPKPAKADMFGGDTLVLTQLLANAVQQLMQLRQLLSTGQDSLELMQNINQGMNEALRLYETAGQLKDPGIYGDLTRTQDALTQLKAIYGSPSDSSEAGVQQRTDEGVAEAISLNNSMYSYTREIDRVGDQIKLQSAVASPKGAERLTAQSMGVLLHVMNQSLRTQASALKLHAQEIAVQNRKDKELSSQVLTSSAHLQKALGQNNPQFSLPRL